jgi:hypothetical protein
MCIKRNIFAISVLSSLIASTSVSAYQAKYYESSCEVAALINTTEATRTNKSKNVSCSINLDRTVHLRAAKTLEKDNFEQSIIGLTKYINWNRYADFQFDAELYKAEYLKTEERSYRFGVGYRIRHNDFDIALSVKRVNSDIFENSTGLQLKGRYFLTESLYLGFNSLNTSKLQESQLTIGWSF